MAERIRAQALYGGRVQGVGFRFIAQRYANEVGVTGYVRNLWNSRVEIVAEGNKEEIEAFLKRIKTGSLAHYIEDIEVSFTPAKEEFKGFNIKF